MNMDWILGLAGGMMIGTAAAAYLLINGRIMGASGIIGGLVDGSGRRNALERLSFLAGLVGIPLVITVVGGWRPDPHLSAGIPMLIVAGLCVGLGTRMANGCTSGHGVCGISRLSLRGIVATLVYIASGMATVAILRLGLGVL